VFFSYAHRDEALRNELANYLRLLERQGIIAGWHDRRITAGTEWAGAIDAHLQRAQIILLLVSAAFLASDYCYDVELQLAMARHEAGEARVIPITRCSSFFALTDFARHEPKQNQRMVRD
jgi:hypothetical protein